MHLILLVFAVGSTGSIDSLNYEAAQKKCAFTHGCTEQQGRNICDSTDSSRKLYGMYYIVTWIFFFWHEWMKRISQCLLRHRFFFVEQHEKSSDEKHHNFCFLFWWYFFFFSHEYLMPATALICIQTKKECLHKKNLSNHPILYVNKVNNNCIKKRKSHSLDDWCEKKNSRIDPICTLTQKFDALKIKQPTKKKKKTRS